MARPQTPVVGSHVCGLFALLLATACSSSPTSPTPAGGNVATITALEISGLPAPLLFSVPPSVPVGSQTSLGVIAALADGSTEAVKPDAIDWTSDSPGIATVDANGRLVAHQAGEVTITARLTNGSLADSQLVSVRPGPGTVVEERDEDIGCVLDNQTCGFTLRGEPWCPRPGWLFPVHESGTVELHDVFQNGWGSPSNYVIQLSPSGEYVTSFLLSTTNPNRRTAEVPGGYMYAFDMNANIGPCGRVRAVWSHPR